MNNQTQIVQDTGGVEIIKKQRKQQGRRLIISKYQRNINLIINFQQTIHDFQMNQNFESAVNMNKDEGIEVYIRIKPRTDQSSPDQLKKCVFLSSTQENTIVVQTQNKKQYFSFDHIASEDTRQEEMYQKIGHPVLQESFKGYNCCIFAYGQTGAGKTYSILGNSNDILEDNYAETRGILPRLLEQLFETANKIEYKTCQIRCSYLEIYNEQIIDLLNKEIKVYQIREDFKKGVYVDGLSEEKINTYEEALGYIIKGLKNRKIAATSMNSESSRSHAIFTITVKLELEQNGVQKSRFSKIHIVDLAGSQRTKLAKVEGDRLKQGCNINKSLHSLGNVINSLVESIKKKKYIPFRDSKLTFFLKDSLGGNSKTKLLANINPMKSYLGDTISTLMFAKRAKIIKSRVEANENVADNFESLRNQIKKLREQLAQTKFIKNNQLKTEVRLDTENVETQRRQLSLFCKDKLNTQGISIQLDSTNQKILKSLQQNELHFRTIIQLNAQRLANNSRRNCEKNDSSKIKQLFESKKLLEKQNLHYINLVSNFRPFTKIFHENVSLRRKLKEEQTKNNELNIKSTGLGNEIEQLNQQISTLKTQNQDISNYNRQDKTALSQQIQQKLTRINSFAQQNQVISKQNRIIQQYETIIEQLKDQFQQYINELRISYEELQKEYEKQKRQKLQIKKIKRKQVPPNMQSLLNENEYLKLNILELQTDFKQMQENLFKKEIEIKTNNQEIENLKNQILRLEERQQNGIYESQLKDIIEKLLTIREQAQIQTKQIDQEVAKEFDNFNDLTIKLKKMQKQNYELLNKNESLMSNNNNLKKKLNELLKLQNQNEQSFFFNKESLCLTTIEDESQEFMLEKTMNVDLLKEIDKINNQKEILLNQIEELQQKGIQDRNLIQKYFNKNLNLTKQVTKLKEENKHNLEEIRRMYIDLQSYKTNEKQFHREINQLIRYENIIEKIQTEFKKDIHQVIEQHKILIIRNQELNHQNQKLRNQSIMHNQKSKYLSVGGGLSKSMKILPVVKEVTQVDFTTPRNPLVNYDKMQNNNSMNMNNNKLPKQEYLKKRESLHFKKYTQELKGSQMMKPKDIKEFIMGKKDISSKLPKKK